ncbi:TfoX/Sxy family protein [Hyphobacterium sp. CCMP332]|nr:TfoX/Sxy family protein [Hyphobacterium sp. CCMP332]
MPFDEYLSERIQRVLDSKNQKYETKKMFGGICFMVNDKMCIGVIKNDLMARVDPEENDKLVKKNGARPMDFTKRPMKGYIYVEPKGIDNDQDLEYWINQCLIYNPKAKSSKK